jgi:tetratricopeptide (TPR) repeat protein
MRQNWGIFERRRITRSGRWRFREQMSQNSLTGAANLNKLGRVVRYRHDLASAEDYEKRALAIQERLEPKSIDAGNSLNELGHIAFERGDLPAARQFYDRALQIFEQLAPDSVQLVGDVADLGTLNLRRQHFSEARSRFERASRFSNRSAAASGLRKRALSSSLNLRQPMRD